jgi:hypothetical protein
MFKVFVLPAVCLALLCSAGAAAAEVHGSVSIKLSRDHSEVSGRLDSSKKCEGARKVKLYYAYSTGTTFSKVASSLTRDSGRWSIPGPDGTAIPAGRLYAKLPAHGKCASVKSKTIAVE